MRWGGTFEKVITPLTRADTTNRIGGLAPHEWNRGNDVRSNWNDAARLTIVLAAVGAVTWGIDILRDRSTALVVVAETPVYELSPTDFPANNKVVGVVRPGDSIQVLRVRANKDEFSYKIETPSGVEGWVTTREGVKRS